MGQVLAVDIKSIFTPANNFDTIGSLVSVVIQNAFVFAGLIAFGLMVMGGIGFIAAAGSGDTKKTEQAKKTITTAVLGLIVVVGSVWVLQIVEKLTGMSGKLLPLQ